MFASVFHFNEFAKVMNLVVECHCWHYSNLQHCRSQLHSEVSTSPINRVNDVGEFVGHEPKLPEKRLRRRSICHPMRKIICMCKAGESESWIKSRAVAETFGVAVKNNFFHSRMQEVWEKLIHSFFVLSFCSVQLGLISCEGCSTHVDNEFFFVLLIAGEFY